MFKQHSPSRIHIVALALLLTSVVGLATTSSAGARNGNGTAFCHAAVKFDPKSFSHPTKIDNNLFPMVPGKQYVLDGTVDGEPHRVVTTITDLTKEIDGVRTVVLWDVDYSGGEVKESELAFFAQDDHGNVWNVGEYPEEYENGQIAAPSTWIGGKAGAEPGIHMLGQLPKLEPGKGKGWYIQGFVPGIQFLDCAKVTQKDAKTCVPVTCFGHVLVTKETSPITDRGAYQFKYYAPGIGIVRVGAQAHGGGETLDLVDYGRLSAGDLASARAEALVLDGRGCQINQVYCGLPAAQ